MAATAVRNFFHVTSPLQNAITTENSLRSPLLRLPAKARKRIYEHVLSGITWDLTAVAPQRAPLPASLRFPSNYSALLRVSRQLFMETYTLPVSLSTFQVWDKPIDLKALPTQWLGLTSLVLFVSWSVTVDWKMGWCVAANDLDILDMLPRLAHVLVNVTDVYGEEFREQGRRGGQMGVGTMTRSDLFFWLTGWLNIENRSRVQFLIAFTD